MFHWMDGTRYEGQLANGNREGWGVMTNADNDKFRGLWEQVAPSPLWQPSCPLSCSGFALVRIGRKGAIPLTR
jgi:hypothetical protein